MRPTLQLAHLAGARALIDAVYAASNAAGASGPMLKRAVPDLLHRATEIQGRVKVRPTH